MFYKHLLLVNELNYASALIFLQVAHMTKSEMDLLDLGIVGPLLLFVNQYFNCLVNETLVLWICFVSTYIWSYDVESFSTLYIKCCHQLQSRVVIVYEQEEQIYRFCRTQC